MPPKRKAAAKTAAKTAAKGKKVKVEVLEEEPIDQKEVDLKKAVEALKTVEKGKSKKYIVDSNYGGGGAVSLTLCFNMSNMLQPNGLKQLWHVS